MEDEPSELSCSHLTSSSVLGGLIISADWVRLSFSMTRFFSCRLVFYIFLLNPRHGSVVSHPYIIYFVKTELSLAD